ncbi:MAG: GPP34 family phosphoprotein [Proteobacteria bacterium]|nr:GPP34 family phosphoprotein [Pseudomonadota bacterium]
MLVAEHFFLIACDPRSGMLSWPRREQDAGELVAAAILVDLAANERIHLHDGRLRTDSQMPLNHPLLTGAMELLAGKSLTVAEGMDLIARSMAPLPSKILDALFRRDLVHRIEFRDWRLRKCLRYPLRSVQARNEALQLLQSAAHADDTHGLALLLLADASGILPKHLNAHDHAPAVKRLLALNQVEAWAPQSRRVLAEVRQALLRD